MGSLLRDDAVVRAARRSSPADNALLGDAVRDAIRLQEELGLDVITDGEVRRVVLGADPPVRRRVRDRRRPGGPQLARRDRGPLRRAGHRHGSGRSGGYPSVIRRVATAPRTGDMAAEYGFLARYAQSRTKFTMPAPSYHRRYWSPDASPAAGYSGRRRSSSPRSATTSARSRTR